MMSPELRAQRALDNAVEFANKSRRAHIGEKLGTGIPITEGEKRRVDSFLAVYDEAVAELAAKGETPLRPLRDVDRATVYLGYAIPRIRPE